MSTSYSSSPGSSSIASPPISAPVRIGAGTAIKIGFFGALGATLFSLAVSAVIGAVIFVLLLLGITLGPLVPIPR